MAAIKAPARVGGASGAVRATTFRVGTGTLAARQSAITAPTGGGTVDAEARTAINAVITALEAFGLVTPN
jgi:hypothetical protein